MNKSQQAIQDLKDKLDILQIMQIERKMNLKTLYSGELQKGDFIVVSGNNSHHLGFYLGRGQGGSMQYYGIDQLCKWLDNKNDPNYNSKKKTPYKWYVNSPHPHRISKYSEKLLNDEWLTKYEKALEALKLLNI